MAPNRLAVFTVLLGHYDELVEQSVAASSSADFICFTDDPGQSSATWTMRPIAPLLPADLARSSRYPKLCAHRFLTDYDLSIYIDASVLLTASPERLLEELFVPAGANMVCFQHSFRASVADEFAAVIGSGRDDPGRCREQLNHYSLSPHFPVGPPIWGGLLMRRHHAPDVVTAMELWFDHVLRYSRRDQLSFNFVASSLGFQHTALPRDNYDSGHHIWPVGRGPKISPTQRIKQMLAEAEVTKIPGRRPRIGVVAPANPQPQRSGLLHFTGIRARPAPARSPEPVIDPKRRPVVFLAGRDGERSASSEILSRQFSRLIGSACERLGFQAIQSNADDHDDALLILSKASLMQFWPADLAKLKRRGNRLVGCFVDTTVDDAKIRSLDALMASSHLQERFFREQYPAVPTFRVNHPLDNRITYRACQQKAFAAGYFGEPGNVLHRSEVGQFVAIHRTDTSESAVGWGRLLAGYNCHYLLRPPLPVRVFKPFLKGYVAAACGAVVVAARSDGEAVHHLSPDYPFLVDDTSVAGVIDVLRAIQADFGGPRWSFARGVMAGITREFQPALITAQFDALLSHFL